MVSADSTCVILQMLHKTATSVIYCILHCGQCIIMHNAHFVVCETTASVL